MYEPHEIAGFRKRTKQEVLAALRLSLGYGGTPDIRAELNEPVDWPEDPRLAHMAPLDDMVKLTSDVLEEVRALREVVQGLCCDLAEARKVGALGLNPFWSGGR